MALVEAASASPTAGHRIPSLVLTFDAIVGRTKHGPRRVEPSLLPDLVAAAHVESPGLARFEDYEPCDPRLAVQVRWRDELFRLLPGVSSHPVGDVDLWEWLADAIDPVLVPAIGYGFGDVVEVALRRMSYVASELSQFWPEGDMPDLDAPPRIRSAELDAAIALRPLQDQIVACRYPSRTIEAVAAHSCPPRRLRYDAEMHGSFGANIAIRDGPGGFLSIPAGLLKESVNEAAALLADKALAIESDVLESWRGLATGGLCAFVEGAGHPLLGLIGLEGVPRVLPVFRYGQRQWVAADLVAELHDGSLDDALASSRAALARIAPGKILSSGGGSIEIPDDAVIAKVQVIAVPKLPGHLAVQRGGPRPVAVQDALHIARTAAQEPSDFWYYLADRDAGDLQRVVALGEIGVWEAWRNNGKTLWRSGRQLSGLFVADDGVEQEWADAHARYELEESLLALGLPSARHWQMIDRQEDSTTLCDLSTRSFCTVLSWETPVAITEDHAVEDQSAANLLQNMASGMAFVLKRTRAVVEDALRASRIGALRIDFRCDPRPDASPLEIDCALPVLKVTWGLSLRDLLQQDNRLLQSRLGDALTDCLAPGAEKEQFESAWGDAPPAIGFGAVSVAQRRIEMPPPIGVHQWHQSRWVKELSAHLLAKSVESKTYAGEDAKRLLTETVYPWLIDRLQGLLALHDRKELFEYAITQLEHLHCHRSRLRRDISLMTGFPDYNEASIGKMLGELRESFELSRVIAVLIDELLASSDDGGKPVDSLAWTDMLSLAELCLMSCLGSEMSHKGIGGLQVEVLESGELVFAPEDSERTDIASFQTAVAASAMPDPVPHLSSGLVPPSQTGNAPESIVSVIPSLESAQTSLKEEHAFTLDALMGVFDAAEKWETPDGEVFAATTVREIAEAAERIHGVATVEEYEQAVSWLARTANDKAAAPQGAMLLEHWEIERRAERIDTRPFVQWGNTLYVLPWTASNAWRIMLSYLWDARLPWPEEMLGAKTARALEDIRKKRNRELERECAQAIAHPLLKVRPNVLPRKAQSLGIERLSGEIDILVVDPRSNIIWVIEVKDPHFPYSPRSMSNEIDKFHKPGGHVDKLRRKIADINRSSSAIADKMELPSPNRQWEVRGLFVTRRATPSAFTDDVDIDFCTIQEARELVAGHDT